MIALRDTYTGTLMVQMRILCICTWYITNICNLHRVYVLGMGICSFVYSCKVPVYGAYGYIMYMYMEYKNMKATNTMYICTWYGYSFIIYV